MTSSVRVLARPATAPRSAPRVVPGARAILWLDEVGEQGALEFAWRPEDAAFDAGAPGTLLTVELDGVEVSGGITDSLSLSADRARNEVETVRCVGGRRVLKDATVDQGVPPPPEVAARDRTLGWMSPEYDPGRHPQASSTGTWDSMPYDTRRPEGWPVPTAEHIWFGGHPIGQHPPGDAYLWSWEFSVDAATEVVALASADDSFVAWLDGHPLMAQEGLGSWRGFQSRTFTLAAGVHRLDLRATNAFRPFDSQGRSLAWAIAAVVAANADGEVDRVNEVHELTLVPTGDPDAVDGTFTLAFDGIGPSDPIAAPPTAASIRDAIEALAPDVLEVTVLAPDVDGGPFVIVSDGPQQAGRPHDITVDGSDLVGATATVANPVDGRAAEVLCQTDSAWRVLATPDVEPGLTPGHILQLAIGEAQARGELAGVTLAGTATVDADGIAWDRELSLAVPVDSSVDDLVALLIEDGVDVVVRPDLTVAAHVALGTTRDVVIDDDGAATSRTVERDYGALVNKIKGAWPGGVVTAVSGDGPPWQTRKVDLDDVRTPQAAAEAALRIVAERATPAQTQTLTVPEESATDVALGDTVTCRDRAGRYRPHRIVAITGAVEGDTGQVDWTLTVVPWPTDVRARIVP